MDAAAQIDVVAGGELTAAQLGEFARYVARCNADPAQHIGYLGTEPDDVLAELTELDGDYVVATARTGDALCGLLLAEWDVEIGRTWLYGPWAASADLMDRLYSAVRPLIPAGAAEHELFSDVANTAVAAFADRHGFPHRSEQFILRFTRQRLADLPAVTLPPLTAEYHDQFTALHDAAFPGTFAPAKVLLAEQPTTLVVVDGATLLGYAVLRLRPEQHDAQVQYLAVAEAARGRGIGVRLLTAALHEAFADDRFSSMELVTNNPVARRLYEKVGFTLYREMRSFRDLADDA